MMKTLLVLATSAILPSASGFTVPSPRVLNSGTMSPSAFQPNKTQIISRGSGVWRQMVSDGTDEVATPPPRKRRTRKDGKQFSPPPAAETIETVTKTEDAPAPETPKENVVVMQVRDIRDIVSGAPETPAVAEVEEDVKEELGDDELADDEEWEYYDVDEDGNEIIVSDEGKVGGRGQDDSIEQLLADARSMRSSSQISNEEEETSLKDKVFEVISAIVTIDFFVVLALLAWFLAGIFCSYILKDDAVQIAFNMNFERVTQPALGILMIGSVAGALGNEEEEEEFM